VVTRTFILKLKIFLFVSLRLIRLSFSRLLKEFFSQTKNFLLLLTSWLIRCLDVEYIMHTLFQICKAILSKKVK